MLIKQTYNEKWTTAITEMIELTQKGRLDWQNDADGTFRVLLSGLKFRFVPRNSRAATEYYIQQLASVTSSRSMQFIQNRLEVLNNENLVTTVDGIPALDGLEAAIYQFIATKDEEFIDIIHNTFEERNAVT